MDIACGVIALSHPWLRDIRTSMFVGAVVQLVRIPACHAGGRGFESRPLRHLFESRLIKYEQQGCSSNWQSSGFQIRVLGVRISPPLPYLRRLISKDMSLFAIGVKITLILVIKNSIM